MNTLRSFPSTFLCTAYSSEASHIPSLIQIATRATSLAIFQANLRWRRLNEVIDDLQRQILQWNDIPPKLKRAISDGLNEAFRELKRWNEKHVQMFPEAPKFAKRKAKIECCASKRVHRGEHLRLFHRSIVWRPFTYYINDLATAKKIIKNECGDWPLMKFQFACCYAMEDLLEDEFLFDKIRRKTFKKQLDDHCAYNFWLRVLDNREEWHRLYRPDRILVDQCLLQVFRFAMFYGYFELVRRLWDGLAENQQEAIGFLYWKKICFRAEHRELTRFLCERLCRINPQGMIRLTWDSFYYKVYKTLDEDGLTPEEQLDNFRKLECLLENWCDHLRSSILARENFRAITDTFLYNRPEAFSLFLDYLDRHQLGRARELVDRVYDRKRTKEFKDLRQMILRRQQTIE
ncbi:hypothetical protein DdX_02780 [Ditylenchus destructor]|uniref:Uncharacterized protein n=1 Tax=Ditylenchus destructor TaxID=166010 RepID=A0AAD4NGT5_9BILA|nr:hypothetical protein DdX_02780 [Ditylenchus destructor]